MAILKLVVVGLVLALSIAPMAEAVSVQIDPDGGGADATISVGSLDWNVGNALIGAIEQAISQNYAHSALSNFNNELGKAITTTGLNTNYEWTYVLGVNTNVTQTLPATILTPRADGENYFEIWFDSTPDSNQLAGTGFNDGVLILSGHFSTIGVQTFTALAGNGHVDANLDGIDDITLLPIPLDEFGANDYPGVNSVVGAGGGSLQVVIDSFDPAFFLTPPPVITMTYNTNNNLNYSETDPSAQFTTAGGTTPGVGAIGSCNGCAGETAPSVMVQVDASSSFQVEQQVPFPGTLMLIGAGLGMVGGVAALRRRKA
jgi:hypothetical protein